MSSLILILKFKHIILENATVVSEPNGIIIVRKYKNVAVVYSCFCYAITVTTHKSL